MTARSIPLDLSELRRQLEEILAIVSSDLRYDRGSGDHQESTSSAQVWAEQRNSAVENQSELFDEALDLITEFGQASAAILQMWLAIDYARAEALLTQLESQGLLSSKGRVRHKAYELRRSRSQDHPSQVTEIRREPVS
jgi:DNA segregation ATPase FtsK/SpoIIIE-like protein